MPWTNMQLLAYAQNCFWWSSADDDDYAELENGKKPASNGKSSPKRKTPKSRQPPADNGFVDIDPEEAAKQN